MTQLSKQQMSRLRNGHTVQLKHSQIAGCGIMNHAHELHPETVKKLHKAHRLGKGARIQLSHQEIHAEGIGSWLKGAWNTAKNFIKSDTYQKILKPVVRAGVDMIPMNSGTKAVVNEVGKQTGAFGLKKGRKPKKGGSYKAIGGSYATL